MKRVAFKGDLPAFFEFMRTDAQFYYPDTTAGREAWLAEANKHIVAMRAKLPELFVTLPKAEVVVKAVEPFREKSAGKAFYQRPSLDGSRPGTFYGNLYQMKEMPKYELEALVYHEAIPGHHMQNAVALEESSLPRFRRIGGYTAYSEGWGLYSERLGKEVGFYADNWSEFGRLAMELHRAVRLVVDTGLHAKRWTREQTIRYHVENSPTGEAGRGPRDGALHPESGPGDGLHDRHAEDRRAARGRCRGDRPEVRPPRVPRSRAADRRRAAHGARVGGSALG